jgi:hypothetical protein
VERYDCIPFLDILVKRDNNGYVKFDIHRKSNTHTKRVITNDSFTSYSYRSAAFHCMCHRLFNIPLSLADFNEEKKNYIYETASKNGYDTSFVDKIFKKHELKIIRNQSTTIFSQNVNTNETNSSSINARIAVSYFPPTTSNLRTLFKKHQIQLISKSDRKLKSKLPSTKDKTAENKKSGIYQISCGTKNCNQKYIGQTARTLKTHVLLNI